MDQVALVGPRDGNSLKWHIHFSRKNNSLISRTFYIHCETDEVLESISKLDAPDNVFFIPESKVLDASVCQNKWIYQQLLKLSVDKLRESHDLTEQFLFTDVDTIPFRKVEKKDFFHEGDPIFYITTEHEQPVLGRSFQPPEKAVALNQAYIDWHYGMSWTTWDLLGIKPEYRVSAIDACVLWSQRVLRKLKRHLEEQSGLPWEEAILNSLVKFYCLHRKHFVKNEGFREVSFSSQISVSKEDIVPLEELLQRGRLGFSEWQLYAHFVSYINDNKKMWLGHMGRHPKPHVGEFNTAVSTEEELRTILDNQAHSAFIYFYPGLDHMADVLEDYC